MKINRDNRAFPDHALVARKIAADGMVLLKNNNSALPLAGKRVALFGTGQIEFYKGGRGSAAVKTAYNVNLYEGLLEKDEAKTLTLDRECSQRYIDSPEYMPTPAELEEFASRNDVAVLVISRDSGEGTDPLNAQGDFLLSDREAELLSGIEKSPFKSIAVVINAGRVISLDFAAKNERIDALAYVWQPGMEGGAAAADVLSGDVNFSGKLVDTFVGSFEDYPFHDTWNTSSAEEAYEEDIYVGYRYFETVPAAREKVLYPFGFGLSYTEFQIDRYAFEAKADRVEISCRVTNIGSIAGREVIQLYSSLTGGVLEHPAVELRDFAKTKLLRAGESEVFRLVLPLKNLQSFDDRGCASGKRGCWMIDSGCYRFNVGNSIRNTVEVGRLERAEVEVLEYAGILFEGTIARRMYADGTYHDSGFIGNHPYTPRKAAKQEPRVFPQPIRLPDVAEGRASMDDFISQLSIEEMAALCCGQPVAFPMGTAGIGNLLKFGVPNPQTADGPAGLRKAVETTCFPCETLVACSWDRDLQFSMGKAMGCEGIATGIDILLAPGMNLHRSPLCGRNFEYYSEDPLVSGRAAAAVIQGMQSEGMGATLKHFALHNRDTDRYDYSSQVSERALREIYLAGFELAIKTGKPWCVMSSYNALNGIKTSCNYNLLTRLLREDWGFEGAVMTDWNNNTALWREIAAGNDLKMPICHNNFEESLIYIKQGSIDFESLRASVRRVLNLVMKTDKFKKRDFGRLTTIGAGGTNRIKLADFSLIAATHSDSAPCDDVGGGLCMQHLAPIEWRPNFPVKFIYRMQIEQAGKYKVQFRYVTIHENCSLALQLDDGELSALSLPQCDSWGDWRTGGTVELNLPAGQHQFFVEVRGLKPDGWIPSDPKAKLNWFELTPCIS